MEESEYVETSEPEEHEIGSSNDDLEQPRKRIKLNHTNDPSYPLHALHITQMDPFMSSMSYSPAPRSPFFSSTPEHSSTSRIQSPTDISPCRDLCNQNFTSLLQHHTSSSLLRGMSDGEPNCSSISPSSSVRPLHSLPPNSRPKLRSSSLPPCSWSCDTVPSENYSYRRSRSLCLNPCPQNAGSQNYEGQTPSRLCPLISPVLQARETSLTLPPYFHLDAPLANEEGGRLGHFKVDENNETRNMVLQNASPHDMLSIPRYTFRRRAPAQIMPYTVDKLQYEQALSANPDAIISNRELKRLADHHRTDEFSQALWGREDDDTSMRAKGIAGVSAESDEGLVQYPDILQDLPLTGEEEEGSLQAATKESKKARIRKFRLGLEQRTDDVKQRPKPFPFRYLRILAEPDAARTQSFRSSLFSDQFQHVLPEREDRCVVGISTPFSHLPSISDGIPYFTPKSSPLQLMDDGDGAICESEFEVDGQGVGSLSDLKMEMSQRSSTDAESEDFNNLSPKMTKKQKKQFKSLNRLYPAFMVEKLLSGPSKTSSHRLRKPASEDSGDEDDEAELLPGQTRTKWSKNSWELPKEIKGGGDSSDDGRDASTEAPEDVSPSRAHSTWDDRHHDPQILDLATSSEESSDVEVVQSYLNNDVDIIIPSTSTRQQENLIRYMLGGPRRVGPTRNSRVNVRSANSKYRMFAEPRYKKDVVVGGIPRGRQTLLDFDHRIHTEEMPTRRNQETQATVSTRHDQSDLNDQPRSSLDDAKPIRSLDPAKRDHQKAKAGENREGGVYTFASYNVRVVTGRRETGMITIDAEDQDFHRAIAPLPRDWRPRPVQMDMKSRPRISHGATSRDLNYHVNSSRQKCRHLRDDFGIQVLRSGISFSAETYIVKGMLYELASLIKSDDQPPTPNLFVFQGIELGPATSIDEFTALLSRIVSLSLDRLSSSTESISLPQDWRKLQHATNQVLSWLLAAAAKDDVKVLQTVVQEQTSIFVSRMRSLALQASSIGIFMLSTCWFAVELFARAKLMALSPMRESLGEPLILLVDYLLDYGLEPAILSVLDGATLDGSTIAQYSAELWISLFHLTDSLFSTLEPLHKQIHPFWMLVKVALESERSVNKPNLEASELIWHSIFSLCALSQFSIHGMTTGAPRLPACWELVTSALKRIRLHADPSADQLLPNSSLKTRDRYIGFITTRCFYLWHRWRWQLGDASTLFSQLAEIFRSRKFAGLRHERPDYPSFLRKNDWTLLSKHEPDDTAFALFLKLLVQAAPVTASNSNSTLSPKIKKLLSITTPVGSLPFSKQTPMASRDLSMLYNRLSAIAVGIHLDPARYASRISQAQSYVNFSNADEFTRLAVVQGMTFLGVSVKNAKLPMDGITAWIEKMAGVLIADFKALQAPEKALIPDPERVRLQNWLIVDTHALIHSVQQVIAAYKHSEYPEPLLLSSILFMFKAPHTFIDVPKTAEVMRKLLQTFLDARKAALPQPELSRLLRPINQEPQESQDEYGVMEMDYDDPAFLAVVGVEGEETTISNFATQEEMLKTLMDDCLVWWAWRNLNKALNTMSTVTSNALSHVNYWLDCWLGCVEVSVHAGGKTWKQFLDLTKQWKLPDGQNRRVNFNMWMRVLILDPMTYLSNEDRYMETFLMVLASARPTLENSFVQLLMTIASDRHPLLISVERTHGGNSTYEHKPQEILRVVLSNLAGHFRQALKDDETLPQDCDKYIGFCIKMFQTMKDNLSDLTPGSEEQRKYWEWCSEIFEMIEGYEELRTHVRLGHWISWSRRCSWVEI